MTDEELDALVYFLRLAYDETKWTDHLRAGEAADAITALRTQLAEANARADRAEAALAAQPLRSGWADVMSSAIQRFEVAAAVNGSATWNPIGSKAMAELLKELSRHVDRAEAALAAQIEVDAGIAECRWVEWNNQGEDCAVECDVTACRDVGKAIRAQPHDRSALDRLLAEHELRLREAREKALRDAAEICSSIRQRIANGPMPEGARFDYEQSILALIEAPNAKP